MSTIKRITVSYGKTKIDEAPVYVVKHGETFLATITFDGPRKTIRTHQGSLSTEERKEVYLIARAGLPVKAGEARHV
jgi:hypothetical protein